MRPRNIVTLLELIAAYESATAEAWENYRAQFASVYGFSSSPVDIVDWHAIYE